MRYSINLATRTYLDNRLVNRTVYFIIVLVAVLTARNISLVLTNAGEQSRLNSEIATLESRLGTRQGSVAEAEMNRQRSQIRFYNEIIGRKSHNWLKQLEMFENTALEGISLSSLIPGKKDELWKLDGRARSFGVLQNYLEKLEASESFSNVMLLSHQNITVKEKERGIQFRISCKVVEK